MANINMGMRELRPVNISWLPSGGKGYPEDLEIQVAPMNIRERKLLDGSTASEYYRRLLDGIVLHGTPFKKTDLYLTDVQFLDLVRRIFTFNLENKIKVTQYFCPHCKKRNVHAEFLLSDLEVEDIPEEMFGQVRTFTDDETGETTQLHIPGKSYKFSDGMEVIVAPLTVGDFMSLAAKYVVNADDEDGNAQFTDMYIGTFTYLIRSLPGREFKDDKARRDFLFNYISNLYSDEDQKVLDDIESDSAMMLKPIIAECPDCSKEVEVYVRPSMRFQQ